MNGENSVGRKSCSSQSTCRYLQERIGWVTYTLFCRMKKRPALGTPSYCQLAPLYCSIGTHTPMRNRTISSIRKPVTCSSFHQFSSSNRRLKRWTLCWIKFSPITNTNTRFCYFRQCAEKYMRDALGSKGTRLLDKWVESGEALQSPMPKSVAKLFYIVFRLLQNVR